MGLVIAVAIATAGCSGGVTLRGGNAATLITDDGFLTGDEAAISGTVTITQAGCVGISAQGTSYPAVWPRGTTAVDGTEVAIDIPGIGTKRLGDEVQGTGGYYEVDTRPVLNAVAERCDWDGEVIGIRFE
ncbi:hypothetical protein [Microbacterium tumbae]